MPHGLSALVLGRHDQYLLTSHYKELVVSEIPSPTAVSATEFKVRCLELMDEVAIRRISYIVTKRGVPVAELVPIEGSAASPIGILRGTVVEHDDLVAPDHAAWSGSADPLDEE